MTVAYIGPEGTRYAWSDTRAVWVPDNEAFAAITDTEMTAAIADGEMLKEGSR